MPSITLVVWNIETFGDQWNAQRGVAYTPICNFIARVLDEVEADIFFMMELRSGGAPYLATLQAALDARETANNSGFTWEYDYIPGAVITGQGFPVTQPNQLAYTQEAHGEGYAVFWRDVPDFAMLDTRVDLSQNQYNAQSQIGLIFTGRTPAFDNNTGWFNAPNFNPAAPPVAWNQLDFTVANPIHAGDIRFDRARRPAYCVIDLERGNGPALDLVPIVVYHAPNSNFGTPYGVQASAYSVDFYQVDDTTQNNVTMTTINQAIVAGDFNLDASQGNNNPLNGAYNTYVNAFNFGANNNEGGANLPNVWVNNTNNQILNYTAIRLNQTNGTPIVSNNPDLYRWLAIDNLFYRGLNAVAPLNNYKGPVYNVIADVMAGGDLVNAAGKQTVIQSFRTAILTEVATGNYPNINPANNTPSRTYNAITNIYGGPVVSNLQNYTAYMNDLQSGYFTAARRAAEFYVNSISDHLPLIFRFDV